MYRPNAFEPELPERNLQKGDTLHELVLEFLHVFNPMVMMTRIFSFKPASSNFQTFALKKCNLKNETSRSDVSVVFNTYVYTDIIFSASSFYKKVVNSIFIYV